MRRFFFPLLVFALASSAALSQNEVTTILDSLPYSLSWDLSQDSARVRLASFANLEAWHDTTTTWGGSLAYDGAEFFDRPLFDFSTTYRHTKGLTSINYSWDSTETENVFHIWSKFASALLVDLGAAREGLETINLLTKWRESGGAYSEYLDMIMNDEAALYLDWLIERDGDEYQIHFSVSNDALVELQILNLDKAK